MENVEEPGNFIVTRDELGELITVTIDNTVYSREAVFKSAYWFTNGYYIFLARGDEPHTLQVQMRLKNSDNADSLENSAREFCNRLADQQVREFVASETGMIRDVLIKKAFFEGSKHFDPDILRSNETNVPLPTDSYVDDPLKVIGG